MLRFLPNQTEVAVDNARASAEYRMTVAQNLLQRLFIELNNVQNEKQKASRIAAVAG